MRMDRTEYPMCMDPVSVCMSDVFMYVGIICVYECM
jgi:hypothetical protein